MGPDEIVEGRCVADCVPHGPLRERILGLACASGCCAHGSAEWAQGKKERRKGSVLSSLVGCRCGPGPGKQLLAAAGFGCIRPDYTRL